MEEKILVTYASKNGATREIAARIGESLREAGLQPDVLPVDGVGDLKTYKAVVLGSAIYIGKWQNEAVTFLRANEGLLAERPVWLFSSGPTGEGDPVELVDGWRLPAALQAVADRIRPRDIAVFHGHINPDRLSFIERGVLKAMKKPFGDYRDWDGIRTWTASVADALKNGGQSL